MKIKTLLITAGAAWLARSIYQSALQQQQTASSRQGAGDSGSAPAGGAEGFRPSAESGPSVQNPAEVLQANAITPAGFPRASTGTEGAGGADGDEDIKPGLPDFARGA